jgi:hypothetical protein
MCDKTKKVYKDFMESYGAQYPPERVAATSQQPHSMHTTTQQDRDDHAAEILDVVRKDDIEREEHRKDQLGPGC